MKNEDFQKVHKLIAEGIKGTRFESMTFYTGGFTRDIYLKRDPKTIEIVVNMYGGGAAFATFLTKRANVYKAGINPLISTKEGKAQFTLTDKTGTGNVIIEAKSTCKEQYADENGIRHLNTLGSVLEDAHSRDFTINTLQVNVSDPKYYFDRTGMALSDLKKKLIRTTTDPDEVFKADPQRMLRAIRFASELGFSIERETWMGICRNAHRIEDIPLDRTREEINKILILDKADEAFRRLYHCGIMDNILPELSELKGLQQGKKYSNDAFEHSLSVMMDMKPSVIYRLSGLLHDVGKSLTKNMDYCGRITFNNHEDLGASLAGVALLYLGYPNSIVDSVETAIRLHTRFSKVSMPSKQAIKSFKKDLKENDLDLALSLIDANNKNYDKKHCKPNQIERIRTVMAKLEERDEKDKIKLPVTGKDIMKKFTMLKGPRLGKAIDLLKEHAIISPKMTKEDAFLILSDALKYDQI